MGTLNAVTREDVAYVLSQMALYANVTANVALVMQHCGLDVTTRVQIKAIVDRLAAAGQLAMSANAKEALDSFYTNHPEFAGVWANNEVFAATFLPQHFTADNLEAFWANEDFRKTLSVSSAWTAQQSQQRAQREAAHEAAEQANVERQAEVLERKALVAEILAALRRAIDSPPAEMSSFDRKYHVQSLQQKYDTQLKELQEMSLEDLRIRAAQAAEKRRLASMSVGELAQTTRDNFKVQRDEALARFPKLPEQLYLPGQVQSTDMRQYLLYLSRESNRGDKSAYYQLKRYLDLYGRQQCEALMAAGEQQ